MGNGEFRPRGQTTGSTGGAWRIESNAGRLANLGARGSTGCGLTLLQERLNSSIVPESPNPSTSANIPPPDSEGGETYVRCPEGRHCRLILVDENQTLVYCDPLGADVCSHAVLFEGTSFCRALLGSKKRNPESLMSDELSNRPPAPSASVPPGADVKSPAAGAVEIDPKKLTPEEQMERFAKELKEKDWGHQPC
jgi:hypothetical protein